MVNHFVTIYPEQNKDRFSELLFCIQQNIQNQAIHQVFLLKEPGEFPLPLPHNNKVIIVPIKKRPTYSDIFSHVNSLSNESDINIIANTDIFFDDSIKLLPKTLKKSECYALTRWEYQDNHYSWLNPRRYDSQDTWIFKGKIRNIQGNFFPGKIGCDSRIAFEIKSARYKISNPSLSIKSFHYHHSEIRNYDPLEMIPKPHIPVRITNLNNWILNVWFYLIKSDRYFPFRFCSTSNKHYIQYWIRYYKERVLSWIKSKKIYLYFRKVRY